MKEVELNSPNGQIKIVAIDENEPYLCANILFDDLIIGIIKWDKNKKCLDICTFNPRPLREKEIADKDIDEPIKIKFNDSLSVSIPNWAMKAKAKRWWMRLLSKRQADQ
jgi:hypothetical protein